MQNLIVMMRQTNPNPFLGQAVRRDLKTINFLQANPSSSLSDADPEYQDIQHNIVHGKRGRGRVESSDQGTNLRARLSEWLI